MRTTTTTTSVLSLWATNTHSLVEPHKTDQSQSTHVILKNMEGVFYYEIY